MKKILVVLFALALAMGLGSGPARAGEKINPDKLDLKMDVAKLGQEQVRRYLGALQAKSCFFIMDAALRGEFKEYQYGKCGDEFYYNEDPGEPFSDAELSAGEKELYARLKQREAELQAGQVKTVDGVTKYDEQAIVNRSRFSHLEPAAWERLLQDGMVAVPGAHQQLFHVYEENDYKAVPSFITTDSVLQLYHLYFDFTLREVEEEKLLPAAAELSKGMAAKLKARHDAEPDPAVKAGLSRAALYFAVAEDLSGGVPDDGAVPEYEEEYNVEAGPAELLSDEDFKKPAPEWLPAEWRADFMAQRELILKAAKTAKGPVMATVDYTMFQPRGHYTRSVELARYFRTMMWLGLPGFVLDEKYLPLETGLAVVYELTRDPALMKKYDLIYQPTSFYVGPTDDITPMLTREVADGICGKDADLNAWFAKKEEIKAELIRRDPTRIKPQFNDDRALPQVRFMGMRYVPDSDILQRLIHVELRPFPAGLDLFGVMGVPAALEILKAAPVKWPGYWPEMEKLSAEFKDLAPQGGGELNLYWRWIRLLKTLNQPAPSGAPAFMSAEPWKYKNLNTALASWAELRHDTILYTKPAGAECGGDETPPRSAGLVEARPDFFKELAELQRFTTSELKKRGLLTERLADTGARMTEMFAFLEQVSQKEVAGEQLTALELDDIRVFGSRLEYLTAAILSDKEYAAWTDVSGPDRDVAVIADVYTYKDQALEEAVGHADELYVLVEQDGYLYVMRGAVFSYYEFTQPVSERLSDEKWQEMLNQGKAPARPGWVQKFLHHQPAGKPSDPYLYSSGC